MKEQIEITINVVASEYKLHPEDITGDRRVQPIPEARMMVVRLIREYFNPNVMTYERISRIINRGYSNGSRQDGKFKEWIRLYPDVRERYQRITEILNQKGYEKTTEDTPTGSAAPAAELHAEKQQAV
jgi:hypothetical protein